MIKSENRILTTHAGSLPRPPALTSLFARRARGEAIDTAALDRLIDEATRWVIPKQVAAGVDILNNGEQPREAFFLYVRHRMSGFNGLGTRRPPADVTKYPAFVEQRKAMMGGREAVNNFEVPTVTGEVRYLDPAFVARECDDFRAILDADKPAFSEAFVTAPSPGIIAAAIPNEHYDTFDNYLDAIATALKVEYDSITRHGFLLQLDCPDLALEHHVTYAERPMAEFLDFVERAVGAINRSLADVPRENVRLHVCWGNYEGPHDMDVPLNEILPILQKADVGAIVLPFANPRHAHEYKVLGDMKLADDQNLVAGVIDTTSNYIEHPETIADRIERIAQVIGDPSRVIAGTDCGFDTSAGMGKVAEDVVWAKLRALADGAKLASERLF